MQDLDLAYCTTVHKSQGSEYQTVIMVVSEEHKVMLKRNIIYTGVTRAKQNVALIGQTEALNTAILNNQTDVRHTLLGDRLHAAFTVKSWKSCASSWKKEDAQLFCIFSAFLDIQSEIN